MDQGSCGVFACKLLFRYHPNEYGEYAALRLNVFRMKYIGNTYVLMITLIGLSLMLFNANLRVDFRSLHRQIVLFSLHTWTVLSTQSTNYPITKIHRFFARPREASWLAYKVLIAIGKSVVKHESRRHKLILDWSLLQLTRRWVHSSTSNESANS